MPSKEILRHYIRAFESAYLNDDWSLLRPCLEEDVVYDTGLGNEVSGRDPVINYFKESTERFDRRFDSRTPVFEDIADSGDQLSVAWRCTYRKAGAPDLVMSGTERASMRPAIPMGTMSW